MVEGNSPLTGAVNGSWLLSGMMIELSCHQEMTAGSHAEVWTSHRQQIGFRCRSKKKKKKSETLFFLSLARDPLFEVEKMHLSLL